MAKLIPEEFSSRPLSRKRSGMEITMSMTGILVATLTVGAVGLFVGLFLGVAGIKFKVEVDEKEEAVLGVLPGNNCGGCGYAGCSGLAAAIAKGEAPVNACPVGGEKVGQQVAQIMGVEAEAGVRKVAFVRCSGDKERTRVDYEYSGIEDCRMLSFVPNGGPKSWLSGIRKLREGLSFRRDPYRERRGGGG